MAVYSCKDCGNRFTGCHGSCKTYQAEKAEHDKLKAKRDFEKRIDGGLYAQRDRAVNKITNGNNGYKLKGIKSE